VAGLFQAHAFNWCDQEFDVIVTAENRRLTVAFSAMQGDSDEQSAIQSPGRTEK
jgi:hypothetical protein